MWILCTSIPPPPPPPPPPMAVVPYAGGMPGTFSPPPRVSDSDMHHGMCVTHVPWCMLGLLTSGILWSRWRKNVPGIPGACATPNFAYLVRGPLNLRAIIHGSPTITWIKCIVSIPKKLNWANIGVIERCQVAETDMAHLLYFMMLYFQSFHYDGNPIMGFPGNKGYANNGVDYFPYSN